MGMICGILGDSNASAVHAMAKAMQPRAAHVNIHDSESFTLASSEPFDKLPTVLDGSARAGTSPIKTARAFYDYVNGVGRAQTLKLRGHFAAAVHHDRNEQWWLIRDRSGIKPLFYYVTGKVLLFASEMKGLLASGLVPRHLNLVSVDHYLTVRCVPGPDTILQGVRRVPPGYVVRYSGGSVSEAPFHSFAMEPRPTDRDEAADRLRGYLERALGRCDVDGMLWSAGLDSATMAALRRDIRPIYVTLEKGWRDETRKAEESAHALQCDLATAAARKLTEATFSQVARALDEPIADAAVLPLWLIMQRASEQGRQIMTGHGADELFGGYPRYRLLEKTHEARQFVPSRLVTGVLPALPPNAFIRRGSKYLARIRDNMEAYLSLLAVFDAEEREELYTSAMKAALHEQASDESVLSPHFQAHDIMQNVLSLDLSVTIPDLVVAECDRIAAAHGISLAFPFLDDELVDFVLAVPANVKYGVRSKSLLRHAMKGLVPARIRLRPQRGFRIPQEGRVMRVIENAAAQILTQDRVESAGIFRWQFVEQVVRSAGHNVYRRRQFWSLLMFFAWYREVMEH